MRFLFDSAVVGVRPRMSAARKRRCGGRFIAGKTNAYGRKKNTCGGRSGRTCIRYKRKACGLFLPANSEADLRGACVGDSGERENKEPCARQGRKDRKEVLRTDKNGRGKSKPRARGKRAHGRERRIAGKQVKMNCFCGFFIQKRQIKAKKMRKTG